MYCATIPHIILLHSTYIISVLPSAVFKYQKLWKSEKWRKERKTREAYHLLHLFHQCMYITTIVAFITLVELLYISMCTYTICPHCRAEDRQRNSRVRRLTRRLTKAVSLLQRRQKPLGEDAPYDPYDTTALHFFVEKTFNKAALLEEHQVHTWVYNFVFSLRLFVHAHH